MKDFKSLELMKTFLKWQKNDLSSSEQRRLQEWLAAASDNHKEWERIRSIWQNATPPLIPEGASLNLQWEALDKRIQETGAKKIYRPTISSNRFLENLETFIRPAHRLALTFVFIIGLITLITFGVFNNQKWQTVEVSFGQQTQLELSDGSLVHLNAGSTFRYSVKFSSKKREVSLYGEAFFEIQPNRDPFVIETPHSITSVRGTSLNVRTWDEATKVFVTEGQVSMRGKGSGESAKIVVKAGQLGVCQIKPILTTDFNPKDLLAWQEKRLVFRNRPLPEVLDEIERFYNVTANADASLLSHTISASFANEPVSKIMETLAITLNAKVERRNDGYNLSQK